jgi:hypothetical protein
MFSDLFKTAASQPPAHQQKLQGSASTDNFNPFGNFGGPSLNPTGGFNGH